MSNLEPPEISEETKIIIKNLLKEHPDLVVVGPAGSWPFKNRFRIYAHGGRIAGVPFNKNNDWLLLPDKKYKKYNEAGLKKYFDKKSEYINDKDGLKGYMLKLFQENTDNIIGEAIKAAEIKFSTENGNPKERAKQTELVRKYLSEDKKSGYIICDMEHTVVFKEETLTGKKRSDFDIIIMNPKSGRVGLIELKCNSAACGGKNKKGSDLQDHLADMVACLSEPEYVRYNILYRYACLQKAGLISKELPTAEDIKPNFFCGFLFIDDGNRSLDTKNAAVKACKDNFDDDNIDSIKANYDSILFLYADSVANVNFNDMQSWDDFSNN